jgi:thymidylate synthase ThyX
MAHTSRNGRDREKGAVSVSREHFSAAEQVLLAPYVTNLERPVFALQHLPAEVVAVLFAYYSRSRDSLRRNLLKLISAGDLTLLGHQPTVPAEQFNFASAQEKARQFHEKWVVGYGHASVAEHAVAHLAIEDVSIVASKVIEDMRLASYTEKSTRYVEFDTAHYYPLPELAGTAASILYHDTVRFLFTTYSTLLPQVIDAVKTAWPRPPTQTERGYHTACRAKALDLLRYVLPAATLTNLGMTINGRALEHLLTKLLSHPVQEVQQLGAMLKAEAIQIMPTLLKYAQPSPYMMDTETEMRTLAGELLEPETPTETPSVRLVRAPQDAETELVAAILYGYSQHAWSQVLVRAQALSWTQKEQVVDAYLRRRGPHDQPLRALEHLSYTFEILVDYGAYRDIHRHRIATQTRQQPVPEHGYSLPEELEQYGFREVFETCMARAATTYQQLATNHPQVASYVLPLAYRCRVLITWNLREMYHFVQLRSARQGHASYRKVAQAVYHELARTHPLLAHYMRVDLQDYALSRL